MIESENLNEREAKHYIEVSLRREYASENGTDFNNILPKMSPLNPLYLTKKHKVLKKLPLLSKSLKVLVDIYDIVQNNFEINI